MIISVLLETVLVDLVSNTENLEPALFNLGLQLIQLGVALVNLLLEHGVGLLAWLKFKRQLLHL